MDRMYHTKRRYSTTNKILKSCKRVAHYLITLLQKKTRHSTSITSRALVHIYHIIHHKLMSLGIRGTTKVIGSIASIFVFIAIVVIMSGKSDLSVFANGSLGIKEVDDAYISLDGAILDSNTDFGARFAYIVKPGDTLDTIAREFGITVKSLTDNNGLASNIIKPGQELIISSVDGFVYDIKETTTIRDFALKYKLDLQDLKELNALQNDHDILQVNDEVFVPLTLDEGKLLGLIVPDPEPQVEEIKPSTTKPVIKKNSSSTTKPVTKKTSSKSAGGVWRVSQSRVGCFGFVPGQCTCYAAQKRPDIFVPGKGSPWRGNARQWYNNAKAAGYSVGTKASIGSIAVMSQGWGGYGHVGIVVDVSEDSVLLESMNWVGPYIVNRIWIDKSRIRGYIY